MKKRKLKKILLALAINRYTFFLFFTFVCMGIFFGAYFLFKFSSLEKRIYLSPIPQTKTALQNSDNKSNSSLELSDLLSKAKISIKEITNQDTYYHVVLLKGEEVLFAKQKDLKIQVTSLQLVIKRLTIEGKHFVRLDFRYNEPVLVVK